ncbi:MAG: methyltransferase domain-containing protein [Burkholderiales bacterium]
MTSSTTATAAPADPNLAGLVQAERFIQQGKFKDAAGLLNQMQTQVVGDPRVFMMGMRLAEAAGNPDGAIKAARQAVKIAPQWAPAVLDLALLLARQNQFVEAATEAQKAVALAPGHLPTLQGAIDIAHRAGYSALALEFLPQAIELAAPNNHTLQLQMAQDLSAVGRHSEAIGVFSALLEASPGDVMALQGRAHAAFAMGDRARAQADWQQLVNTAPANEGFRYHLAVAQGQTPTTQPASMARELFDGMAPVYDQHMVRGLRYQLPKKVADWILATYPDRKTNVLDLGCGTGLLGVCLGRLDGFLIGVDVSEKMIEQAARHGVYDRFHAVNVLDALQATPADLYEVLTALDVFIYVGDLTQAIPNAHRIVKPGGHFVFSCERALETEADCLLRPSNRYAHKQSHIEQLCRSAGFAEVTVQDTTIRYEGTEPVNGYLVTARKAAAGEVAPVVKEQAVPKVKAVRKPRATKKKDADEAP